MNLGLVPRPLSVRRELWLLCRLRCQLARNSFVSMCGSIAGVSYCSPP